MLAVSAVDLHLLVEALEDHTDDHTWWFDPRTGRVELCIDPSGEDDELETEALIPVDPFPSRVLEADMAAFAAGVRETAPRIRLARAAENGDWDRFREVIAHSAELAGDWAAFIDARRELRAVEWLADEGLITGAEAERELASRRPPAPAPAPRSRDGRQIAEEVAEELRSLYGDRLRDVVLVGSRARGEGHPESDVDLLVVLDQVDSPWAELARADAVLWRHSQENDVVVTAVPVAESDLREFRLPVLVQARDGSGIPYVDAVGRQLAASFEELGAARLLAQAGYARAAVSRAYLAAFLAAEDALRAIGERRAKHARAVALFIRRVVHEGGLDPLAGKLLRSLYERRDVADEARLPVPAAEAMRAVADAERVVTTIAAWLATQAA